MGFGNFLRKVAYGFNSVVKPGLQVAQGLLTPLSIVQPQLAPLLQGVSKINNALQAG